jgi:protein-disulfide isomerase
MNNEQKINPYLVPIAIVIAGIIIAGSIIYVFRGSAGGEGQQAAVASAGDLSAVPPVSANDHIFGNPNAKVFVIEYADTECPFCKLFQSNMAEIINGYEASGNVAWVYRYFPLDQLHKKSRIEAASAECAAELGGNDVYWNYLNKIYEITPSNDGLDVELLLTTAEQFGMNKDTFQKCVESGKYADKIEKQFQEAAKGGARGSPWTVIFSKSGKKQVIDGAQPAEVVKAAIDKALKS